MGQIEVIKALGFVFKQVELSEKLKDINWENTIFGQFLIIYINLTIIIVYNAIVHYWLLVIVKGISLYKFWW